MISYKEKYLKYKNKYFNLVNKLSKNLKGGQENSQPNIENNIIPGNGNFNYLDREVEESLSYSNPDIEISNKYDTIKVNVKERN